VVEPDFVCHSDKIKTKQQFDDWVKACIAEGDKLGTTWGRVSRHPTIMSTYVYEAWKQRPEIEDMPEPTFKLKAVK
jgi:hypothetical protein